MADQGLFLVAVPDGINRVQQLHPDVDYLHRPIDER